jgi:uncharacterized membrane-anchored protein YhcB (DUF1043 family)
MSTPQLERELDNVRVVDFRLTQLRENLEAIYDKQDELLRQLYRDSPAIYQDFRETRAARLEEVYKQEQENCWLLQTWLF